MGDEAVAGETIHLASDEYVFRAMRSFSWMVSDTNEVLPAAFLRRRSDTNGLSVNTTLEACRTALEKVHGVGKLNVGDVRGLGLDVKPDFDEHANINTGLPYQDDDPGPAEYLAGELAKNCSIIWRRDRGKA